ncbi:MAG: diphosphomevalonate decarboxylase, partial [Thermoplasmatota archaeon]
DASPAKLSEYARLGAGSACRAVTGGVSEWVVEGERSYSRPLWNPGDGGALEDWRIVVPLVQHEEPTENVHQEVLTSPLFQGRLDYLPAALDAARAAVREGDLEALAAVAERDTLNLHAVTMTSESSHLTWQPATVAVMRAVWELRDAGTPVHFSMDTGATAYLNTHKDHEEEVAAAVADLPGIADVLRLHPAGPTRLVDDHLF